MNFLFKDNNPNPAPGSFTHTKSPEKVAEQARICENCTDPYECAINYDDGVIRTTCTIQRCQRPGYVRGATVRGNVFSVGSKVKLRCLTQDDNVILQCLANGTWSLQNPTCPCLAPNVPNTMIAVVPEGNGLVRANTECVDSYTLIGQDVPLCNTTTDVWTPSFNEVCCDDVYVDEWQKIFRYQGNTVQHVIPLWNSNNPDMESVKPNCTYGNNTILRDWNGETKLRKVKLNVIKHETVVAYIIFDAVGSDKEGWFNQKRILESSWEDLTPDTELDVFSIHYNEATQSKRPRFFIGKKVHEHSCDLDLGWFAVAWSGYPCNAPENVHMAKIVYSPQTTATKFVYGHIDTADRFEVWISKL